MFDEFYYLEEFYKHLKNAFIVLIPKMINAMELKDYCLISHLSSVYKIFSKTLTLRLKLVMKGLSLSFKVLLLMVGRFLMECLLLMNVLKIGGFLGGMG